jgi:hypothetical protein
MSGEMWSREICDRLDAVIDLLTEQNKILSDPPAVSISGPVELTEPAGAKTAPAKPTPAKAAPATSRASTPAKK